MLRRHPGVSLALLIPLLIGASVAGLSFGAVSISTGDIFHLVLNSLGFDVSASEHAGVFWQLRVPRVLIAILVGGSLAVAGALMQGLFRNPLADPGLIGVSSGAALGAVGMIVLGAGIPMIAAMGSTLSTSLAALIGAWVTTAIILKLASYQGTTVVASLLLAGIAINAFAGALIGLCIFLATDSQLRSLNFWMLGSLGSAGWGSFWMLLPFALILLATAPLTSRALNALALGEAEAGHLGFRPEHLKWTIVLLTSIGVGGCVAQTGMIGFVGLVVPHLFRMLAGPDHRRLIPGSAMLGASLLVIADTIARTVVAPAELPIGIITAAVGAPFFLFLLIGQRRGHGTQ